MNEEASNPSRMVAIERGLLTALDRSDGLRTDAGLDRHRTVGEPLEVQRTPRGEGESGKSRLIRAGDPAASERKVVLGEAMVRSPVSW